MSLVPFNAALSGEQRRPPYLNHCDINTKAKVSRKRHALGIRLKRFVRHLTTDAADLPEYSNAHHLEWTLILSFY
ncbi:hypothetical protein FWP56_21350 [Vibrio vulnificus]|nr:hypothetical protein [Vibrio vulnificus]